MCLFELCLSQGICPGVGLQGKNHVILFDVLTRFVAYIQHQVYGAAWMLSLFSHVQLSVTPMECSPPGSSVHGILQARILEWVAIPYSRGSSRPRDWTRSISYVSCVGRWVLYNWCYLGCPFFGSNICKCANHSSEHSLWSWGPESEHWCHLLTAGWPWTGNCPRVAYRIKGVKLSLRYSDLSAHQDHLEGWSVKSGMEPGHLHLPKFPGDAAAAGLGTELRELQTEVSS